LSILYEFSIKEEIHNWFCIRGQQQRVFWVLVYFVPTRENFFWHHSRWFK